MRAARSPNQRRIILITGTTVGAGAGIIWLVKEVTLNTLGDLLSQLVQVSLGKLIRWIQSLPLAAAIITILFIAAGITLFLVAVFMRRLPIADAAIRLPAVALIAATIYACSVVVIVALARPGTPSPHPSPTVVKPTLTMNFAPTPSALPRCFYELGEWPCLDEVRNTQPRDTLYRMARRNYHIDGDVDPIHFRAICNANLDFLYQQFMKNIPPKERHIWGNDPCNYLVPGNLLIIPIPPSLPSS